MFICASHIIDNKKQTRKNADNSSTVKLLLILKDPSQKSPLEVYACYYYMLINHSGASFNVRDDQNYVCFSFTAVVN